MADPRYRRRSVVISVAATKSAEARLLSQLRTGLPPNSSATLFLFAPPCILVGHFDDASTKAELEAGSSYVIAEAREAGNVGIYRGSGEVREGLVQEILTQIPGEKIVWEAPQKAQQLYFIELLGCNVNLGNIAPTEVISLEAMRIGLRGDTFNLYLNKQENG